MSSATMSPPIAKRYKLLRGMHIQIQETDETCPNCNEGKISGGFKCLQCKGTGKVLLRHKFKAGEPGNDIVESIDNLQLRHGWEKFQDIEAIESGLGGNSALLAEVEALRARVLELEAADNEVDDVDLSKMRKAELLKYAASISVDLTDCTNDEERRMVLQDAIDTA